MEAKDTIMDLDEYNRFTKTWYEERGEAELWLKADDLGVEYKATLEHQAEISFPLGKQEGIKEVVEDMEKAMDITKPEFTIHTAYKCLGKWQAFPEGIDKEE